jgi:hypothetical protein
MPRYRIRHEGFFMGKFYAEGAELDLHERQAKYAIMSGQLEAVNPPPTKARRRETPAESKIPPRPADFALPRGGEKPKRDEAGEFSKGRKVGGTFGGTARKG